MDDNTQINYNQLLDDWAEELFSRAAKYEERRDKEDMGSFRYGYYSGKCDGIYETITILSMLERRKGNKYKINTYITHDMFKDLSLKELNIYLDFLGKVMFDLNAFEVWEAENVFSEEDEEKWDKEAVVRYCEILKEKEKLEDKIYGDNKEG